MNFFKLIIFSLSLISAVGLTAQQGTVRGTVIEDATGEPLSFVTISLASDPGIGTTSDFDGTFSLDLDPGTYSLLFSYISYQEMTITDVVVEAGKVNLFDNVRMTEDVETLEAVVVSASQIRNTETALLTIQRNSPNLLNGISSQSFKKIGDGDAAAAVKRVTGVSIEGGKYVYVRGLGDRYTKTMLNGVDIPGLDPERNSLQIDIFPTNLINNIFVSKTAIASMPADFTGGVINIETKDFPEEKNLEISASIGFNPRMHFNDDYLSYPGSSTDWLGYDDGLRAPPVLDDVTNVPTPGNGNDTEVANFLNQFSYDLGAIKERSFLDYSMGISYANQVALKNDPTKKLGYIFSTTYKKSSTLYDDIAYGDYQLAIDPNQNELLVANALNGVAAAENIFIGALAGLAYKTEKSKYRLTAMHLQNGESKASELRIINNDEARGQSGYAANTDNLEYFERGLTNILLGGKHYSGDGSFSIDWRLSPTFSKISEPDIRTTAFTELGSRSVFSAGAGGLPKRIWRSLEEINVVGRIDLSKKMTIAGADAKFNFGFMQVFKERDYQILQYNIQFENNQPTWSGDASEVYRQENLFPRGPVWIQTANADPNPNEFNSNVNNTAGYVSLEFVPFGKLKSVLGLRVEKFVQRHTGRDQFELFVLNDDIVLDNFDFFPSANFIYPISESSNLRGSYSRTIARPSFKEMSFAQILDPLSNRIFVGGLFPFGDWDGNLRESRIDNMDLRWEIFGERAQTLSFSGFYKRFDQPIELVRIKEQVTGLEVQPRNVGNASLFGIEMEFKKNLDFLNEKLSALSISGNVTLVDSRIDRTPSEIASRTESARTGQTIEDTRDMAGQAPYTINAGIAYTRPSGGFDAGIFYNVKGRTLAVVGGGIFPDVYSEPFHSLNFNLNKNFGDKFSINLKVNNILGDVREEFFSGFQAIDQVYTQFTPGTSFGLGIKYAAF